MIGKFFEKASVLKVVSVFIALLVWLYVIYIEDPEVEITVDDIPVSYKVTELPDSLSLVNYEVKEVDIKIRGNRSDIIEFEEDELVAVLDLSAVSEAGKYDDIKISVTTANKNVEIIDRSDKKTYVQVDEVVSKRIDIVPEFSGEMPKGYIVSKTPVVFIDTTQVRGAKSFVESVKGGYIKIDCDELSESKTVSAEVYLKDEDGKVIDEDHIAYKHLTIGDKEASAYVTVEKTDIADVVITDANEDEKYTVSPSKIEIYGKNNLPDVIYTESIKDKKADKDGNITLKLVIPSGVTVATGETSVKVKVKD